MNDTSSWLIGKSKSSLAGVFKPTPDCKLKVRMVGNPVKLIKVFSNDKKCAILDTEDTGKKLKAKYPKELNDVVVRYACWCFDRNDDNALKIIDMPFSIANSIGNRQLLVGKKVGGLTEGCDWSIITNGKKGKDVRYEAVFLDETPLTDAEKKMVEDKKADEEGQFDLSKFYKTHSFVEAEKLLFN